MGIRDLGLFQDLYQFVCGYIIYAFIAQDGNNVFFDKAMITFVIIKGMTPEGLEFFYGTFKDGNPLLFRLLFIKRVHSQCFFFCLVIFCLHGQNLSGFKSTFYAVTIPSTAFDVSWI